jgi:dTDP-4-amino-4,6-dideoxygalactose transaminase
LGTFGVCGILSFNGNKIITASAGGALVSEHKALAEYARYLQQEAKEPVPYYEHKEVGYNYRFSNILAALGRSQLQVLSERVSRRREVFTIYKTALARYDGIEFQEGIPECVSNRWLTAVIFNSSADLREQVREALQAGGVESRPVWKPMHLQPVFKDYPAYANGTAEHLFANGLCLPSGTAMPEDDIHYIAEIIKQRLTLL